MFELNERAGIPVVFLFLVAILVVTGAFIFALSTKEPPIDTSWKPSFLPANSVNPSPSLSPSPSPLLSVDNISKYEIPTGQNNYKPRESSAPAITTKLDNIKVEKENGKTKLTLSGSKFGNSRSQILLDNNVHNYGYTLLSWTDDRIELYTSEWVPQDKNVAVAVIGSDGNKSNTLYYFNSR